MSDLIRAEIVRARFGWNVLKGFEDGTSGSEWFLLRRSADARFKELRFIIRELRRFPRPKGGTDV